MAATQADVDALSAIIQRGIDKVVDQDGRTHEYDLAALTAERDRLQLQLNRAGRRGPSTRAGIYNPAFRDG